MIIELLLDKKIKKSQFKRELSRFVSISQIEGKENYLLEIKHVYRNMQDIKETLDIQNGIVDKLKEEKITYTTLTNEPSSILVRKLYPLAQEFENKLRKFISLALCDTNDMLESAFNSMKNEIAKKIQFDTSLVNSNLTLEYSDLSNVFKFLFSDKELIKFLKEKNVVRDDNWAIHKQLTEVKNSTIWNTHFKDKYKDFHFHEYYYTLYDYRNDIMHFHHISYERYIDARKLFTRANKEISIALGLNMVIPVEDIFSSYVGINAVSQALTNLVLNLRNSNSHIFSSAIYQSLTNFSSKFYDTIQDSLSLLQSKNFYTNIYENLANLTLNNSMTPIIDAERPEKEEEEDKGNENEQKEDNEDKHK